MFDTTGLKSDLISLKLAQAQYMRALAEEEAFLKQKARLKWLDE